MSKACPKCGKSMVQGFIPDYTHGGQHVSAWYEGAPKKSFWLGVKVPATGGQPLGAFRCQGCGFLEFYAGSPYAVVDDK